MHIRYTLANRWLVDAWFGGLVGYRRALRSRFTIRARSSIVPYSAHPSGGMARECYRSVRDTSDVTGRPRMNIMFFVRSMGVGGAERQLCVLCRELLRRGHSVSVLLYYGGEPLEADLGELGVRIIDLKKRGRLHNLGSLLRLIRTVRAEQPDVVYALLPMPNLLALLLRIFGGGCAVACGVRASDAVQATLNWRARVAAQLERRLVRFADVVIVNSQSGARYLGGERRISELGRNRQWDRCTEIFVR